MIANVHWLGSHSVGNLCLLTVNLNRSLQKQSGAWVAVWEECTWRKHTWVEEAWIFESSMALGLLPPVPAPWVFMPRRNRLALSLTDHQWRTGTFKQGYMENLRSEERICIDYIMVVNTSTNFGAPDVLLPIAITKPMNKRLSWTLAYYHRFVSLCTHNTLVFHEQW